MGTVTYTVYIIVERFNLNNSFQNSPLFIFVVIAFMYKDLNYVLVTFNKTFYSCLKVS